MVNTVFDATASTAAPSESFLHEAAHALQDQECAWPSLMWYTVGFRPTAASARAGDAENQFLLEARNAIAAVEAVRDVRSRSPFSGRSVSSR